MIWVVLARTPAALAQDSLVGGTQPNELAIPLDDSAACDDCHAGFENAPVDVMRGTMMAMAMHDPMFQASLVIAEQDIPGIGEFCLRCHTPPGWLEGRCIPGDGSALLASDYEGISCDTCHRMKLAEDGPLIGNARYTIDDTPAKRGSGDGAIATHQVIDDPYLRSSELCGVCHEVSNPLFGDFPIERTYSEWAASGWSRGPDGKECQDCHLEEVEGVAATDPSAPVRPIHPHRMVGGNTLVPRIIAKERPDLGVSAELEAVARQAQRHLEESATVEVVAPSLVTIGVPQTFHVKVTNESGHKLPTGYPEGRRLWLEVVVTDRDGVELLRSGTYDEAATTLPDDPQLRKYEARLGSNGEYSYHMVQQDEVIFDGRIPPRGFRPTSDIAPVGRTFETLDDGTLANWDLAPYEITVPEGAHGPVTVTANLWHQTTTAEFVAFLRDENRTNLLGDEWYRMWEEAGRGEPDLVRTATGSFELTLPEAPDEDPEEPGGCGCDTSGPAPWWLLVSATVATRRRGSSRRGARRGA
ncbi:MAG: hypothetical protein H6735_18075 [Alphaproteobacteria bacterium]|nr:hypothetical protein [Alphaproteobacteria bacterium]